MQKSGKLDIDTTIVLKIEQEQAQSKKDFDPKHEGLTPNEIADRLGTSIYAANKLLRLKKTDRNYRRAGKEFLAARPALQQRIRNQEGRDCVLRIVWRCKNFL